MTENLKFEFPSLGSRQMLTARREILDAFDSARDKARAHEIETFHGQVGEAAVRKWLANFLPKRFGVTSGYVISPGLSSKQRAPHFDVIIYDQIEAPILWVEDSADASEGGKARALPVEHVRAVLEVKSSFSRRTVVDALGHLGDLGPVMKGTDNPGDRYKLHLPNDFRCGLVFVELRKADEHDHAAAQALIDGVQLRGFFGGIVLRGEGHTLPASGKIQILRGETPVEAPPGQSKKSLLGGAPISPSRELVPGHHFSSMIMWGEPMFTMFAFDLLAMIQGRYDSNFVSSFYGLGV